uniref:Translation initiation factor IF-2, chloroplastic n=1 Tax=Glossina austeni TaxID=7395 RepID=A0A1A9UK69_GLOAU
MTKLGIFNSINEIIEQDVAQLIAEDMGHRVKLIRENALEESLMFLNQSHGTPKILPRPPIVTVMGHVDHGKTSLLDYIRTSTVSLKEVGGITQHIGAYLVKTKNGNITFLDTPGHSAFTAMRARGAQITDIVILVVAADDSVMPQTIEAIQHAKNAQVPIIIAINKIDKNTADPLKVKKELMQHGIIPEEYGGENQCILVSAKSGEGINLLLEAILLQAEILELKADYSGIAHGVVIESRLDKGKGPIATILINSGKLNRGDTILCGCEYGRIRAIKDSYGKSISSSGPSVPVEILGLSGVPIAGDKTTVLKDEKKAREIAIHRKNRLRENKLKNNKIKYAQNAFFNTNLSNKKIFNIILKSDMQGTLQAISDALKNLCNDKDQE